MRTATDFGCAALVGGVLIALLATPMTVHAAPGQVTARHQVHPYLRPAEGSQRLPRVIRSARRHTRFHI